ncbi:hypothetical protein CGCVW01_v014305 [Colletotrichum viniferum]|nr:hypothetical protein CGCVW01_v014305 [Colletotrichum viniferum]
MQHLFSRQLSECSVGLLRELCDEVSCSLEARSMVNEAPGRFSSRIKRLSEKSESLESRHTEINKRPDALMERTQVLEVQNEELQKNSVRLENRNGKLERQNERLENNLTVSRPKVGIYLAKPANLPGAFKAFGCCLSRKNQKLA